MIKRFLLFILNYIILGPLRLVVFIITFLWSSCSRIISSIDVPKLKSSFLEVIFLTIISFLPILASMLITAIELNAISPAIEKNIIPGEMVAFSLSFIAPTLYFFLKTHGHNFKLPFLLFTAIVTYIVYTLTGLLYVIAKNKWIPAINMEPQYGNLYFRLSLIFLAISFVIWIYTLYHEESFTDYNAALRQGQDNFNDNFKKSLTQGTT